MLDTTSTDMLFADWGQPATLVRSSSTYDPATGQITTTATELNITVIPGPVATELSTATQALAPEEAHLFLMRSSDLPAAPELLQSALYWNAHNYAIRQLDESSQLGITLVHTRQQP
jgi:hypothetical protein